MSSSCYARDYSPPGSSVCRISQARILEWAAISFSRGSSPPPQGLNPGRLNCRQSLVCSLLNCSKFFTNWASRETSLVIAIYLLSHAWLFCNPMNCSLLGSSIHGVSWARILEWAAIYFSRGSSQPRDRTCVSCITGRFFTTESMTFVAWVFLLKPTWVVFFLHIYN